MVFWSSAARPSLTGPLLIQDMDPSPLSPI